MKTEKVQTPILDVACEISGASGGLPVVLLHGFPYDPRCFDAVVPMLTAKGLRTIVPYVRGFGATRFRATETLRSGQQGAIGRDVVELLDALGIERALLAGFDWGARAACVVAALWPERVVGLVTTCGYLIQDIARAGAPADPEQERRYWYQYYFNTERGRAGLAAHRHDFCALLWKIWSPTCPFDAAAYARTAESFANPDFVDVSVHSYRHRYGYAAGDPRYDAVEARLAELPKITVPTIAPHGEFDDVIPAHTSTGHEKHFTGRYEHRLLPVGHNPPQEAPEAFARAILDLAR